MPDVCVSKQIASAGKFRCFLERSISKAVCLDSFILKHAKSEATSPLSVGDHTWSDVFDG
jgi:hypothetical protein